MNQPTLQPTVVSTDPGPTRERNRADPSQCRENAGEALAHEDAATKNRPASANALRHGLTSTKHLPRKQIQDYVFINHRTDVAIVATVPEAYGDEIVAIGRYYLNQKTNEAEVAFTVRDEWQNRGIGTFLLKRLTHIARRNGISGFTAEVLTINKAMQSVLNKSENRVACEPGEDVYSFKITFE